MSVREIAKCDRCGVDERLESGNKCCHDKESDHLPIGWAWCADCPCRDGRCDEEDEDE